MRTLLRWAVIVTVVVHGLIHLMGAGKGFGWADVSQLTEPIDAATGVVWLFAAVLVVAAGALMIARVRLWWVFAVVGAVVSQAAILTSWKDAKAGTIANVVLAIAAAYGYRSQGPTSFRARFWRLARETTTAAATAGPPVAECDLAHLPAPVAAYVRSTGAVGRPRLIGFRAEISGRIRSGPDQPWMNWTGQQVNTFGSAPSRVFFMDATMRGMPADILHTYVGPAATMQVRVASTKTIVDARGPEMNQAETVTLLNDMCILAPAALVDAPIEWTLMDDRHARATYTNAGHTVIATLTFNDADEPVDFVSDDRLRASVDGRTFDLQRWSTPIAAYEVREGRRFGSVGTGRWHPDDEPSFDYLEFHTDDIAYLEAAPRPDDRSQQVGVAREPGECPMACVSERGRHG